ncbi:hypothetical protein O7A70_06770 [Mesorhizobium sp. Cs1299R1N1]|uniref:hypothetical protein n=1 Tax=Mesorhizobium sp. Cs1299R1N1 TaxID=3015172 RepID=UPI00301BC0DF
MGALWWSDVGGFNSAMAFGDEAVWLWVASPHTETTFSILGNTGVALLVLAISLAVSDTRLHVLTAPIATVGSMSLTAYVLHIGGIWVLQPGSSSLYLLGFLLAISAFAM